MAFAENRDNIARRRKPQGQAIAERRSPPSITSVARPSRRTAARAPVINSARIAAGSSVAGVVVGSNHHVSESGCRLSHRSTLLRIPISAAAEDNDPAPGADRLQRGSDCLRRMGEVHIDQRRTWAKFHALHPSCDVRLPKPTAARSRSPPIASTMASAVKPLRMLKSPGRSEAELQNAASKIGANSSPIGLTSYANARQAASPSRLTVVSSIPEWRPMRCTSSRPRGSSTLVTACCGPLRGEERGLGLEVGLQVAVKIQMISTEVGESRDVEADRLPHDRAPAAWEKTSMTTVPSSLLEQKRPTGPEGRWTRALSRWSGTQSNATPLRRETDGTDQPGAHSPRAQRGLQKKKVVAVLPFVPVTAHIVSASAGRP